MENNEEQKPPTRTEVEQAIQSLANNKSPGSDNRPAELIKSGEARWLRTSTD